MTVKEAKQALKVQAAIATNYREESIRLKQLNAELLARAKQALAYFENPALQAGDVVTGLRAAIARAGGGNHAD